jgi:dGTPase
VSVTEATPAPLTERARVWASTMGGFTGGASQLRQAHADSSARISPRSPLSRAEREAREARDLAIGATRANGAGNRAIDEAPDEYRTCFERDRDRILHSNAFRRLAGKTQVFVFPDDHQRTRLTHALEVAQVATAISTALSLNVALTEAIALGHDCGHGPGGHASEDALSPFLEDGFDHAVFGADVMLAPLNLTEEVLDGIRNHSWSRPAPSTPEGEVVSWADRIAYVCHDFEDAARAQVVDAGSLPRIVRDRVGTTHAEQLGTFVDALVKQSAASGSIGMDLDTAAALAEFRAFNYERIYLRKDSVEQADAVVAVLSRLVEHLVAGGSAALDAVAYVAGMTDKFAFNLAVRRFDYPLALLPQGIDSAIHAE